MDCLCSADLAFTTLQHRNDGREREREGAWDGENDFSIIFQRLGHLCMA